MNSLEETPKPVSEDTVHEVLQPRKIYETDEYKKVQAYHLEPDVNHYAGERAATQALDWVMPYMSPGQWILNIGCQTGAEQLELRGKGIRNVVGIDLHPELAFNKGVVVLKHDMHSLPFDDSSFDLVYSRDTLEHSPNPEEVLLEVKRVLRPEGKAFFSVPVEHHAPYHFTIFSVESWRNLFSGFFSNIIELYAESQYIAVMSNTEF